MQVDVCTRDFCSISRDEFDELFGRTDLFIYATDFFPAQARGNVECLRLEKPGLWIGLYPKGRAGEIVYYVPDTTPACYRCVCDTRYAAFATGTTTRVSSSGGTILDLHLVDAIAGQIVVGILTKGTNTRFGRLIDDLGNRNLLQVKIDPRLRDSLAGSLFVHLVSTVTGVFLPLSSA